MPKTQADYPRQPKQREIENPTRDKSDPRPVVWDQTDSEDRAVGYHHEEGLQFISSCDGDCSCGDECNCGEVCDCKKGSSLEDVPEMDLEENEGLGGYYPEAGEYHEDRLEVVAQKKSKVPDEFPVSLKVLSDNYKTLEKIPFQIQLGNKLIEVVVGDEKDLYLIYELQQQVIDGVENLKQAELLASGLILLIELWPTSVFEVEDTAKFRASVMEKLMSWYLEFGEMSEKVKEPAEEFYKSLKT